MSYGEFALIDMEVRNEKKFFDAVDACYALLGLSGVFS